MNIVGEFASVITDLGASKGILICSAGFTKGAKDYANRLKIDLCTAHDASKKEWQTEIQIPVIKKSIKVDVKIQHHYVPMGDISIDHIEIPYPADILDIFIKKWENDEIPKEHGTHYLSLDREAIQYHKDLMPVKNGIEYKVNNRFHFKFFVPNEYRGIKDYITQKFTPTFMAFSETIPFSDDGSWKYIASPEEVSLNTLHLDIEIIDISMLSKKMVRLKWKEKV